MKVVFDTNVLISGFITVTGVSQAVVARALKCHAVILSEYILGEFQNKLIDKIGIPKSRILQAAAFLKKRAITLQVGNVAGGIKFKDPKDIPILKLLEVSSAHYFVTGDVQLLHLKKFGKTLIISPREALEIL